ncbi:MAG: hypothetical protein ACHQ49_00480 [Elusimicrobiota bacterium]
MRIPSLFLAVALPLAGFAAANAEFPEQEMKTADKLIESAKQAGKTVAAEAAPFHFSPKDCDFPLFVPQLGQPACEKIPYSPATCREQVWSEGQEKIASGRMCLGFQKPKPGTTCAEEPGNINCFVEKNPGTCNYFRSSKWSPCLNELFLECLEHGDLSRGRPIWVTPAAKIPSPPSKYWTASEMCHWYLHTHEWPFD